MVYSLRLPIGDLDLYLLALGVYTLEVYSVGLRIADLDLYLLALGVYALGVYTRGVYFLLGYRFRIWICTYSL